MKGLLLKMLGKGFNHTHKVVNIHQSYEGKNHWVYFMEMDCHVQPLKLVVVKCPLSGGQEFDPHFSNSDVIARFQPTPKGWENALMLVSQMEIVK